MRSSYPLTLQYIKFRPQSPRVILAYSLGCRTDNESPYRRRDGDVLLLPVACLCPSSCYWPSSYLIWITATRSSGYRRVTATCPKWELLFELCPWPSQTQCFALGLTDSVTGGCTESTRLRRGAYQQRQHFASSCVQHSSILQGCPPIIFTSCDSPLI